ncbi:MAG: response regulator transcription factor [Anaerolineae bacterium]
MPISAKILVVDDEPNIRFFLEKVLTRVGHEVTLAEDGRTALALIEEEAFNLALIDLKLGDVSGIEVLAALRKRHPSTPVIILTGYASLETAVEALRQGAHDYLFKPVKTVDLRESVRTGLIKHQREVRRRTLLARLEQDLATNLDEIRTMMVQEDPPSDLLPETSEVEQDRFIKRGGLIVDVMRHVITLDGQLLGLSPTEFDVLAYLASEAPRVIPPEELIQEVQGYECEPWEARDTIRYHIYRIRNKIKEATGKEDVIRTVRGVGYGLVKYP